MKEPVLVDHIGGYSNRKGIRAFLNKALNLSGSVADIIDSENPDKLVVVKPNWVQESHQTNHAIWEPLITHPEIISTLVDVLAERMSGKGTIAICDGPHTYADWDSILARGGLRQRLRRIEGRWPGLHVEIIDLRREVWSDEDGVIVDRKRQAGDPRGHVRFNLGEQSLFYGHPSEGRFYGADYDTDEVNRHHRGTRQEYLLAGTPVECDVFINLPKLKTHKKTGITCSLKNLVGINAERNWLPHHSIGSPASGGDEFPERNSRAWAEAVGKRVGRLIYDHLPNGSWIFRNLRRAGVSLLGDSSRVIRNGNWYGNDTCWRMALDLNRCFLHGTPTGSLRPGSGLAGRYLSIVDGIIGGQGNGPLCPDPIQSGALIAGTNPAEVDAVALRLMGFDPKKVPIVCEAFQDHPLPICSSTKMSEILVRDLSSQADIGIGDLPLTPPGPFLPHFGWAMLAS